MKSTSRTFNKHSLAKSIMHTILSDSLNKSKVWYKFFFPVQQGSDSLISEQKQYEAGSVKYNYKIYCSLRH